VELKEQEIYWYPDIKIYVYRDLNIYGDWILYGIDIAVFFGTLCFKSDLPNRMILFGRRIISFGFIIKIRFV
jgi:hypothetical protein